MSWPTSVTKKIRYRITEEDGGVDLFTTDDAGEAKAFIKGYLLARRHTEPNVVVIGACIEERERVIWRGPRRDGTIIFNTLPHPGEE